MNDDIYITLTDYTERGATMHISVNGRGLSDLFVSRATLNDLADTIRRNEINLKYG